MVTALSVFAGFSSAQDIPIITTVAGHGASEPDVADGGLALNAAFHLPVDVAFDSRGNLYVADMYARRIRRIAIDGTISTIAGNGSSVYNGENIPALSAGMTPTTLALDAADNLYFVDSDNHRIRRILPSGLIVTVAGTGLRGFSGDGGPAHLASFNGLGDIAFDKNGNLFVADFGNYRVRRIGASTGTIATVAGNGTYGNSGDGGPVLSAGLEEVMGIAIDKNDGMYILSGTTVRKVDSDGAISTIAGGGVFPLDLVALRSRLDNPSRIRLDSRGNLYFISRNSVKVLSPAGILRTVAGQENGMAGFRGDGGPAEDAYLSSPAGIALDSGDNLYIADRSNRRIRRVSRFPERPIPRGMDAFKPYVLTPFVGWQASLVVGDINGDRKDDVVVSTSSKPGAPDGTNDHRILIFLQAANGTLNSPVSLSYPSSPSDRGGALLINDFDSDGIRDVIVGHAAGLGIVRGNRAGIFNLQSFSTGFVIPADGPLAAADLNRDGSLDVLSVESKVEGSLLSAAVHIGYGNKGGLSRVQTVPVQYLYAKDELHVLDVNGDGWTDIIRAAGWGLSVLEQDGMGAFLPERSLQGDFSTIQGISSADFNGDGRRDIALAQPFDVLKRAAVVLPQGTGGLNVPPVYLKTYSGPQSTLGNDVNGDRLDDLLVFYSISSMVTYYQHIPGHGLSEGINYSIPMPTRSFVQGATGIGDINGDGCSDVVLLGTGGLVSLHGQRCYILVHGGEAQIPGRENSIRTLFGTKTIFQRNAAYEGKSSRTSYFRAWLRPTYERMRIRMMEARMRVTAWWDGFWEWLEQ